MESGTQMESGSTGGILSLRSWHWLLLRCWVSWKERYGCIKPPRELLVVASELFIGMNWLALRPIKIMIKIRGHLVANHWASAPEVSTTHALVYTKAEWGMLAFSVDNLGAAMDIGVVKLMGCNQKIGAARGNKLLGNWWGDGLEEPGSHTIGHNNWH